MNLVRYKPANILEAFQNDLSDLLSFTPMNLRMDTKWAPHVDVKAKNDKYIVIADVPGVDPKDIQVTVEGNVLTIKAERTTEAKEEQDDYSHIERFSGTYYRQFTLPQNIAADEIIAKCDRGVLNIILPKQQKQKESVKKIEVRTEKGE